jgi:hypothetical protein
MPIPAAALPVLALAALALAACEVHVAGPPRAVLSAADIPPPAPGVPLPFDPVAGPPEHAARLHAERLHAERLARDGFDPWDRPRAYRGDPWDRDPWGRDPWGRRDGWGGGRPPGFGPPAYAWGRDPWSGYSRGFGRRPAWQGNGRCDDPSYNTSNGGRAPSGADEHDCRRLGLGDGRKRPYIGRMIERWF